MKSLKKPARIALAEAGLYASTALGALAIVALIATGPVGGIVSGPVAIALGWTVGVAATDIAIATAQHEDSA